MNLIDFMPQIFRQSYKFAKTPIWWWSTLTLDIHVLAIIVTESLGLVFLSIALTFLYMSQKIKHKTKSLENATTGENSGKCYSFEWAMNSSLKTKRLLTANPFYFAIPSVLALGATFILLALLQSIGYVMFLSLAGITIFMELEAYEAFRYGKTITKVSLSQLNEEDLGYMRIAQEALEAATIRFSIVAIALMAAGPFIRQIFDTLIYTITTYSMILFNTTEIAFAISPLFALLIAMILPGILLYLPELIGRTLLHELEKLRLIGKMLRHKTPARLESEKIGNAPFSVVSGDYASPQASRTIIDSHYTIFFPNETEKKKNTREES